jgi:hypothetical protein
MENISRGPNFKNFVSIFTEASMQDNTVATLQDYTEYKSTDFPLSSPLY